MSCLTIAMGRQFLNTCRIEPKIIDYTGMETFAKEPTSELAKLLWELKLTPV